MRFVCCCYADSAAAVQSWAADFPSVMGPHDLSHTFAAVQPGKKVLQYAEWSAKQ